MLKHHKANTPLKTVINDYNSVRDFNPSPYFRRISKDSLNVDKEINIIMWKNVFSLFFLIIISILCVSIINNTFDLKTFISTIPGVIILTMIFWYLKIGDFEYYKIIFRHIFKKPQLKYNRK